MYASLTVAAKGWISRIYVVHLFLGREHLSMLLAPRRALPTTTIVALLCTVLGMCGWHGYGGRSVARLAKQIALQTNNQSPPSSSYANALNSTILLEGSLVCLVHRSKGWFFLLRLLRLRLLADLCDAMVTGSSQGDSLNQRRAVRLDATP